MRISSLLTALLASCALHLCAQSSIVTGRVGDPAGAPLPLATVAILDQSGGTVTDSAGAFTLALPPGARYLVVRALGYAQTLVDVSAPPGGPLAVTLRPAAEALADVVVTAERAERPLTRVPVAVTALPAAQLEATRTWDVRDLVALVPGFLQSEVNVGWQTTTSIRGVQAFSENPAVATYVDGVNYLDILAGGFPLVDVERVEVLRGPQGTLFGRNAMGGVINVVTRAPSNTADGFAEASLGNLGLQRYAAGYRAPLVKDKLFLAVNGLYQRRAGYLVNDTSLLAAPPVAPDVDGVRLGDENTAYGSGRLLWRAGAKLDVGLDAKVQRDRSDASGFFVTAPDDSIARAHPNAVGTRALPSHDRLVGSVALTGKLELPGAELRSTTAFQRIALGFANVTSGSLLFDSFRENEVGVRGAPQRVWTQELRVVGTRPDAALEYTAGVYGFVQDAFEPSTNIAIRNEFDPAVEYDALRNAGTNRGLAVYGQATYALTGGFDLTAGLRYDVERRENTFNSFFDLSLTGGQFTELRPDTTVSGSFSAVSPKLALAYAPTETSSVYASYTRGFRAGGINTLRLQGEVPYTFDPETSDNYEVGYRAQLPGKQLRFGATAYWIDWRDLQLFEAYPGFVFARRNVGDARSRGVELEVQAVPLSGFRVDGALSLTDTEYRDFAGFRAGDSLATDATGNRLTNAPGHTLALGVEYGAPLAKLGDEALSLTLRADVRNIGDQFTDIQNRLAIEPYTYLHARLALAYGGYSLALWGRNLGDVRPLGYGSPDTQADVGSRVALAATPRTFGATLRASF